MEKWKVIVIVLLVGVMGGYGFFQQSGMGKIGGDAHQHPTPAAAPIQKDMVGQPMPAWSIPANYWANTPRPLTAADLKGSVVLLEFFRIKCSHCQEAAPVMEELYNKYKGRGLKVVAIQSPVQDEEKDWENVKAKVKEWGIQYPVAFDTGSTFFKEKFGGQMFPSVYLIDKQGVVRYQHTGHTREKVQQLVATLEPMLK